MASSSDDKSRGSSKGRKQLVVVSADGGRQRFLRGMITHDLIRRGLDFDPAYAIARAIRDRLSDRDEVTTSELRDLIFEEVERTHDGTSRLRPEADADSQGVRVVYAGQEQPFSRGLLARSIHAAGLDMDRAYRLVTELEAELVAENITVLKSGELARRVGDVLERLQGKNAALRYRAIRRIHRLPRPLVIYVGGASGTGKSTLALELGPLLRIYRINATDTIRQVMRMVFTQSILPALHSSSFEVAPPYDQAAADTLLSTSQESDHTQRLIATFEEQAIRVCVGVRAVVERAMVENMSIIVEGVHVHPGMVPFPDLEGAVYQVPLVLATLNEEAHRTRFLARSRAGGRLAERYLESFSSIRTIHDYILQQAEQHDRPILDTSDGDPPVEATMRVVTSILQHSLPRLGLEDWTPQQHPKPTLLVVIDGLADRSVRALGGRTPLQAASTPVLDRLAREGQCGLADTVAPGVVPDTAAGNLALLGQSPQAMKRGPIEALGAGVSIQPSDIALRGNLATLDEGGRVIDRRAGRIREQAAELAAALDRLSLPSGLDREVEVRVKAGTEHRLAVVLRGSRLSPAIQGSDPGEGAVPGPPLVPEPLDPEDDRAVLTAAVLALFEQEARRILEKHPINEARVAEGLSPANAILTRGAGRLHRLLPLEDGGLPLRVACIGGDKTLLGIAEWLGGKAVTKESMTANLDTDLEAKVRAARKELGRNDLVVLHFKGADIAAHDQRPDLKVEFLEKIDRQLAWLLDDSSGPLRVIVASDHATLSESGQHAADPLPILVWEDGIDADDVQSFDEQSAAAGRLQRFPLQSLLGRFYKLS
jgi:2,3-bisphosphoglycerate-independent phosphoglycerate mutase